jgi:hypothetical protein
MYTRKITFKRPALGNFAIRPAQGDEESGFCLGPLGRQKNMLLAAVENLIHVKKKPLRFPEMVFVC